MSKFDITLLTASKFLSAEPGDEIVENILEEDRILREALEKKGLKVTRTNWDNPDFKWNETKYVLFRTPWDYFNRYDEFAVWLEDTSKITKFINPKDIIDWNIDKHYMLDLAKEGINIPPTVFIEPGDKRTLSEISAEAGWSEFILKPAISGGAWHTYRISKNDIAEHEEIFKELVKDKSMLLQEYQNSISVKGEVSYMVIGGEFTHAVLKRSKSDDFRVQDNFGGTVHDYSPTEKEIEFAQLVVKKSKPGITYARVDVMWDNNDELSLGEIEVFEPALWLRKHLPAADLLAKVISEKIKKEN